MKKPWLAFILNFVLPGAGLAYLRKWRWATINFAVVQGLLAAVLLTFGVEPAFDWIHYLLLACAAASGGAAHAIAIQMTPRN